MTTKKPRIFIGSSTEALQIAEAIQRGLENDFNCVIWNQISEPLGRGLLEWLTLESTSFDFAIFVYAKDDVCEMRGKKYLVARDNVILEHGLFLGALGRDRVFFLTPNDPDLHLPSDLAGVLHGKYLEGNDIRAAAGPFCNAVKSTIRSLDSNSRIKIQGTARFFEAGQLHGVAAGEVLHAASRRINYEPTQVVFRVDDGNQSATLNYTLKMNTAAETVFHGPVTASGPVVDGWAYMIYRAIDDETKKRLVGVCIVYAGWGSPAYGYWMTHDNLPGAFADGVVFGGGSVSVSRGPVPSPGAEGSKTK